MPSRPLDLAALALATLLAACGRGDLDSADPARRAAAVDGLRPDKDAGALLVAQRDVSAEVRLAAARTLSRAPGEASAEALGRLLLDPDPAVAVVAAEGLGGMPGVATARDALVASYGAASPAARSAMAGALDRLGVSLRAAVELESRTLWERNLSALGRGGGSGHGAAEEVGASQRQEAVQKLLALADPKHTQDPAVLVAAARGLGETGDPAVRPALEGLLDATAGPVAEAAAFALGRLGDARAADALAAAASAGSGRVAAAAVEALASLPNGSEVGFGLCEVAAKTVDPAVAARAARAASDREVDCPLRPLVNRLAAGSVGAEASLAALAELGPKGDAAAPAIERAVRLLEAPGEPGLRAAAAAALARLGGPAAGPAVAKRLAAALARLGDARSRWVRGPLEDAPRLPAGPDRVQAVLARPPGGAAPGKTEPAPEWLEPISAGEVAELSALLAAAGTLRTPGAEEVLKRFPRDALAPLRAGAIAGLAALGTAEAEVAAALRDPDAAVRMAAAKGLGARPSGAGALGAAAQAIASRSAAAAAYTADDPQWLQVLCDALAQAGGPEAVKGLAALLEGPGAGPAASALARIGSPEAGAALLAALPRTSAGSRAKVVEALAQLAPSEAGPLLAAELTGDRPDVRAAAARAVGRLRLESASPALEALRADYYGRVRKAAVEALAKLPAGAPRVRP
ncbi:MAG: HEAT repeat domain-containing protein [Anaeromyxobacter sp.]